MTRTARTLRGRATAAWRAHWFPPAPLSDLAVARTLLAAIVLYLDGRIRFYGIARAPALAWEPIPLIALFGIAQPGIAVVRALSRATQLLLLTSMVGLLTNLALGGAFVLQLVQEGLLNSLGKVTHSTIPLLHAMLFFALAPCGRVLSLDAWLRARRARRAPPDAVRAPAAAPASMSRFARWPFELLFVELAFYYFDAGLSKVAASGLAWADGNTLQYHLLREGRVAGLWVAQHRWPCAALSTGALAFELGFPLAIFVRRLRPLFLAAGVCFHLGNHFLLNLIFWPVLAVYPLVVPASQIVCWLRTTVAAVASHHRTRTAR